MIHPIVFIVFKSNITDLQTVNEAELELVLECIQRTPTSIEIDLNGSILSMGSTANGTLKFVRTILLKLSGQCSLNFVAECIA